MKKILSCRRPFLFLAFFYFFLPYSVHAAVHVFLGFMDEEVSPVLRTLIQEGKQPIYVIERGHDIKTGSTVFENPIQDYYSPIPSVMPEVIEISGANPKYDINHHDEILNTIASTVQTNLINSREEIENATIPDVKRKLDKDLNFSILKFQSATQSQEDSLNDIIVLVHSPEMGLQPSMMEPTLSAVLNPFVFSQNESTSTEDHNPVLEAAKHGGTYLHNFGTSGAVSVLGESSRPGSTQNVKASVFLGVEKKGDIYQGSVKLFLNDLDKEIQLNLKSIELSFDDSIALEDLKGCLRKRINIDFIKEKFNEKDVSLTVSYFAGETDKDIGRALGLVTVNMEDAHVVNIAKKLGFSELKILRLNCDPPIISSEITDAITNWAKNPDKKYSSASYEDAIFWGLSGKNIKNLTNSMYWTALGTLSKEKVDQYLTPIKKSGMKRFILDPILLEIGTDLIEDAMQPFDAQNREDPVGSFFAAKLKNQEKKKVNTHFGLFREPLKTKLTEFDLVKKDSILNQLMAIKAGRIKKIATEMNELEKSSPIKKDVLQEKVRNLLTEAGSIDFSKNALLQFKREFGRYNGAELSLEELKLQVKDLVSKLSSLTAEQRKASGIYLDQDGMKINLLLANGSHLPKDSKTPAFEGWVRQGKWNGNQERTVEQLVKVPCSEGLSFESECVDRMSYKHGLMFFTKEAGEDFTRKQLNYIKSLRESNDKTNQT